MQNIPSVVLALAPAFAAGFALQRLIEICDSWSPSTGWWTQYKRPVIAVGSFLIGLIVALNTNGVFLILTRIIQAANKDAAAAPHNLDVLVSALIISAGTDGFNSIVKFLEYKKEDTKEGGSVSENPAATPEAFQNALLPGK